MRGIGRRIRSNFGIGSSRLTIRSQLAWYWRWLANILMMAVVAAVVWWVVQNSYRITGSDIEDVRARCQQAGATHLTPILENELGEPSFSFDAPDGIAWTILGADD